MVAATGGHTTLEAFTFQRFCHLENGVRIRRLRLPVSLQLVVEVVAGHTYEGRGNAKAVELLLCVVVDVGQHILEAGSALQHKAAAADICHFVVLLGFNILPGDEFAVHTGGVEAAAAQLQIPVHRKQDAPDIGAGNDTAVFIGVDMHHIVEGFVVTFKGNAEIRKQTQTEAGSGLGVVADRQRGQRVDHHPQIFVQLLCSKVHHMVVLQLVNGKHIFSSRFFFDCTTIEPT